MLGGLGVGAGGEPAVVGVVALGGEDLLAVDDEIVAVLHGGGLERGEVAAGAGLGVAEAVAGLAAENLGEVEGLLLLGAEEHQRRGNEGDAHIEGGGVGVGGLVAENGLIDHVLAAPAVLLRPGDAEVSGLAGLAAHLPLEGDAPAVHLGRGRAVP